MLTTKLFCFMKNAIYLILLLSPLSLLAQIQSACSLPQNINCNYQNDVKALAAELMLVAGTTDANSIAIIPSYENAIWKGLAIIINESNPSSVDDIFNKACIKKRFTNALLIKYNSDASWIQAWMADNATINNPEVAALLNSYSYNVQFLNAIPWVVLNFNEILNLQPLIDLLSDIDDFESVDFDGIIGDSSNINVSKNGEALTFNFNLGWGDCPSGCIYNRLYQFVVNVSNCALINESVSGSPNNAYDNYISNCNLIKINEHPLDALYTPMEFESNPTANFGKNPPLKANGYTYRSNESLLPPQKKIHPKLKPGYSYFWNFGDGNFDITVDVYERKTNHIYNQNGVYNVSVERTKIKVDPKFSTEIERTTQTTNVDIVETPSDFNFPKTTITNRKNVQLINARDAIPGVPFTLVASFKNANRQMFNISKATLNYDTTQLLHSKYDVYYCDKMLEEQPLANNRIDLPVEVYNIKANEQRNFFNYFQVNPEIELGTEIEVCLTYEVGNREDEICEIYVVGKSHDPSFKKFLNPNCFINEELEFLIHIENDGNAPTMKVEVKDSLVPPFKIDTIEWDMETLCHKTKGTDKLSPSEEQVKFTFDPMNLKGTNQPGYLKTFGYEEIKDSFTFKMKLENPSISLTGETYLCNEADVIFDTNPPYPISDCFFCLLNDELDDLPKKDYCKIINLSPVVQQKSIPTIIPPVIIYVNKGESISIEPDLTELPNNAELNFIWWPGQETQQNLTVSPDKDSLYRLLVYWEENDTIFYVEDAIVVELNSCGSSQAIDTTINVKQLRCYNGNDASIDITVNGDYSIFWDDVNDAIYGDQVFQRNELYAGIYTYTIFDNTACCKHKGSITIEEKTPLQAYIDKQQLEDGTYILKAYYFGGKPPYTFSWVGNEQPFNNVDEIGPVPNINFEFEITDNLGCNIVIPAQPFAGNFNCEE